LIHIVGLFHYIYNERFVGKSLQRKEIRDYYIQTVLLI
jgi:hypothetical protein